MMTGAQLAGWLRHLADQVEHHEKVDGEAYRAGPISIQVAQPSTIRTWKQRHGSLDPPSVSDPSHDVIREAIRDAFETHAETLLRRIWDASETAAEKGVARGVSAALDTISSLDLKNTTTSESDRSSRALEEAVVVASGETVVRRETRNSEAFVPCPAELCLNAAQIANLEMNKGIPAHFVRNVTAAFLAKYLGDPEDRRTEANWRKGLGTAVIRTWDSKHRQEYLTEEVDEQSRAAQAAAHQRLLDATDRKARAEDEARRRRLLGPKRTTPPMPEDPVVAIGQLTKGMFHTA